MGVFTDHRWERNRVLARKMRRRKKFFVESRQRQVAQLAKENEMRQDIVKKSLKPEVHLNVNIFVFRWFKYLGNQR